MPETYGPESLNSEPVCSTAYQPPLDLVLRPRLFHSTFVASADLLILRQDCKQKKMLGAPGRRAPHRHTTRHIYMIMRGANAKNYIPLPKTLGSIFAHFLFISECWNMHVNLQTDLLGSEASVMHLSRFQNLCFPPAVSKSLLFPCRAQHDIHISLF